MKNDRTRLQNLEANQRSPGSKVLEKFHLMSLEVLLERTSVLQPVLLGDGHLAKLLEFYMGKNTPDRQEFIIDNLRIELDKVEAKEETGRSMREVMTEVLTNAQSFTQRLMSL